MKNIIAKLKRKSAEVQCKALLMFRDDRGDTNFVSIAIVLTVVLVLAGLFITFGRDILEGVTAAIEEFMGIFNA
jgi:hypothetical protein